MTAVTINNKRFITRVIKKDIFAEENYITTVTVTLKKT